MGLKDNNLNSICRNLFCNDLTSTLRKLNNLTMPDTTLTEPAPGESILSQVLAFAGAMVSRHIQILIYGLLVVVVADLAFIFVYFFALKGAKFSKTDSVEESKDKTAKVNKDAVAHKCTDPSCKHAKHAESDVRVEEDENLVFDEQADVVFMQPGFNIKD